MNLIRPTLLILASSVALVSCTSELLLGESPPASFADLSATTTLVDAVGGPDDTCTGDGCGACDADCNANNVTGGVCSAGGCSYTSAVCADGFDDCDNDLAGNGCESPVDADAENCGACGVVCDSTNATATCPDGGCSLVCDADWDDCDPTPDNGCETDLLASSDHCGACGTPCQATESCMNGRTALTGIRPVAIDGVVAGCTV